MASPAQFFDTAAKDRALFQVTFSQPDCMLVGASYAQANDGWNSYLGGIQYFDMNHEAVGLYSLLFQNIFANNDTFPPNIPNFGAFLMGAKLGVSYANPPPALGGGLVNLTVGSFGFGLQFTVAGVLTDLPAGAFFHFQFSCGRSLRSRAQYGGT